MKDQKTINYKSNSQLWSLEDAAKKAGFEKTADCYWTQIFKNQETGVEFVSVREEAAENDPVAEFEAWNNFESYMTEARKACSMEEADKIIKAAAEDKTISDRRYSNIRRTAIRSAYEVNAICWNCAKLGNGCKGTKNSVWTGCAMKETKEDNEK